MRILLTGAAGFIGFHVARRLLERGDRVVGADNLNAYYSQALKLDRLAILRGDRRFIFHRLDLADGPSTRQLVASEEFDAVVHLAAQAGVRYSLEAPEAYLDSNLTGALNLLEGCRQRAPRTLLFASSSSVYGESAEVPFRESQPADKPVSLYAATKRAGELLAHSYASLFDLQVTAMRFFTVYGPWGRPDMALFKFVEAIESSRPIELYNHGLMQRDFTYIDDIVDGVVAMIDCPPAGAGVSTYNLGAGRPVELERFVAAIERAVGKPAQRVLLPMQPGDVPITYADTTAAKRDFGFEPRVGVEEGVARFVAWRREYLGVGQRRLAA